MKAYTEAERSELIEAARQDIEGLEFYIETMVRNGTEYCLSDQRSQLERQKIALASLKAEPVGDFYEDGPGNWWQIGPHDKVTHVTPLYRAAPPVPEDWKQRAEAAEAKLAELEKQKPFSYLTWHQVFRAPDDCEDYFVVASEGEKSCDGSEAFPVYSRPAANLAEMVPEGWKLVPIEPTRNMLEASYREASVYSPSAYRAMLAASPTPYE